MKPVIKLSLLLIGVNRYCRYLFRLLCPFVVIGDNENVLFLDRSVIIGSNHPPVTRMEASNICLNDGLRLPETDASQESLIEYMSLHNINTSWIGIYPKIWKKNHFMWLDGTEFGKYNYSY